LIGSKGGGFAEKVVWKEPGRSRGEKLEEIFDQNRERRRSCKNKITFSILGHPAGRDLQKRICRLTPEERTQRGAGRGNDLRESKRKYRKKGGS